MDLVELPDIARSSSSSSEKASAKDLSSSAEDDEGAAPPLAFPHEPSHELEEVVFIEFPLVVLQNQTVEICPSHAFHQPPWVSIQEINQHTVQQMTVVLVAHGDDTPFIMAERQHRV